MSTRQRSFVFALLAVLIVGGCTWVWLTYMEKRWIALPQQSDAARENPMLAATRLLTAHQFSVKNVSTLAEASLGSIPDGMLMLAENGGVVTPAQSKQLLGWVKRGNTLVIRPKWSGRFQQVACGEQASRDPGPDDEKKNVNTFDTDPIGSHLGVELVTVNRHPSATESETEPNAEQNAEQNTEPNAGAPPPPKAKVKAADVPPCLAQLTLPNADYPLQLDVDHVALASGEHVMTALYGDKLQEAVRVFAEGDGHIVVVANNYFDNAHLAAYDHAELLLSMTQLHRQAKHVLIIQHLDMPPWYQALWWHFKFGIVSVGCGLLLLFWAAICRFGPILPEPNLERRSLIEHIDASGRWLWKVPGGRSILIGAARASVNKILLRKVPALLRMSPEEQAACLAQLCNLSAADVTLALHQPASGQPITFTRQIQLLQHLRKHYER